MYAGSVVFGLLGLVFLIGNQGLATRLAVGTAFLVGAVGMGVAAIVGAVRKPKAPAAAIEPVPGTPTRAAIESEPLKCRQCGQPLEEDAVELREGAIIVTCPHCGTTYRSEEAPDC